MDHPYLEFEDTTLWLTVDTALAELERNQDLHLTTARAHAIGYLCQQLVASGAVAGNSPTRS